MWVILEGRGGSVRGRERSCTYLYISLHTYPYLSVPARLLSAYTTANMNEKYFGYFLILLSFLTFFSVSFTLLWTKLFPPSPTATGLVHTNKFVHVNILFYV